MLKDRFIDVIDHLPEEEWGAKSLKMLVGELTAEKKEIDDVNKTLNFLTLTGKISGKRTKPVGEKLYWVNRKTKKLSDVMTENPLMDEIFQSTPMGEGNAKRDVEIAKDAGVVSQTAYLYLVALTSFGVVKVFTKKLRKGGLRETRYFYRINGASFQPLELKSKIGEKGKSISKNDVLFVLSKHPNVWLKPKAVARELNVGATVGINKVSALLYRLRNNSGIERVKHSHAYQYRYVEKPSVRFNDVNDSVQAFIAGCVSLKPSEKYPQPALWNDYMDYCDRVDLPIQPKSVFTNKIRDLRSVTRRPAKVDGKSQKYWFGLTFKGHNEGEKLKKINTKLWLEKFAELGYQITPGAIDLLLTHIKEDVGDGNYEEMISHIGSEGRRNKIVILTEDIRDFIKHERLKNWEMMGVEAEKMLNALVGKKKDTGGVKDTDERLNAIDDKLKRVDELHKVNEELREALVKYGEREKHFKEIANKADKDHIEVEQLKKELAKKSNEIRKLKEERTDHFSIQAEERVKSDIAESRKLLEHTFKG